MSAVHHQESTINTSLVILRENYVWRLHFQRVETDGADIIIRAIHQAISDEEKVICDLLQTRVMGEREDGGREGGTEELDLPGE